MTITTVEVDGDPRPLPEPAAEGRGRGPLRLFTTARSLRFAFFHDNVATAGLPLEMIPADLFAPNHKLRPAVTAFAIGNIGTRQEAATGGHGGDGHGTGGCCAAIPSHKPRSHDTSRIAWAKLMARVGGGVSARVPQLRR